MMLLDVGGGEERTNLSAILITAEGPSLMQCVGVGGSLPLRFIFVGMWLRIGLFSFQFISSLV